MPAALAAVALVLSLAAAQVRTSLHVYTPWHGSIPARGVVVDRTLLGACSHGSEVLTRADAWHCRVGSGRAYDPCFSNDRGGIGAHVLCATSPWEDVVAIELTRALPYTLANPDRDPRQFPPWAMVTASHQECTLLNGSTGTIAGKRINYGCAGSGVLLDLPKRGVIWTQAYASSFSAKGYRRVALREVWW
jgi:hypothetical protein